MEKYKEYYCNLISPKVNEIQNIEFGGKFGQLKSSGVLDFANETKTEKEENVKKNKSKKIKNYLDF